MPGDSFRRIQSHGRREAGFRRADALPGGHPLRGPKEDGCGRAQLGSCKTACANVLVAIIGLIRPSVKGGTAAFRGAIPAEARAIAWGLAGGSTFPFLRRTTAELPRRRSSRPPARHRLLFDQSPQAGEIEHVELDPVFLPLGRLEVHWDFAKSTVVHQAPEGFDPQVSGADMVVPIDP